MTTAKNEDGTEQVSGLLLSVGTVAQARIRSSKFMDGTNGSNGSTHEDDSRAS